MDDMVKTVAWSAPLGAVLTSALFWLLRNWIAERLTGSIRHDYNKDLEKHKAILKAQFDAELEGRKAALKAQSETELEVHKANMQRRFHIIKSQFDMEFKSFQSMWTSQSALVDATARLINAFLMYDFRKVQKELEDYAKAADEAFFAAQSIVRQLGPFMPEDIHVNANSLAVQCKKEIDFFFYLLGGAYKNEDFDMGNAIKETKASQQSISLAYSDLASDIRERLATLSATTEAAPKGQSLKVE